jgi:energy-coupling factor transport system permease protein
MSLNDIALGQYIHGTSPLHRLDPRTKLLCLLALMAALFANESWTALAAIGAFVAAAGLVSGLPAGYIARSLRPFVWLILMTVILNVLFVGGHILVEAPLPYGGVTREGLSLGLLLGARIGLLVLAASLMTLTTEPITLVAGVEKLIAPLSRFGVRPHDVATAMVVTIRFIPVLLETAEKIRKSHRARGFNPGGGLTDRLRATSIMLLPLFASSIRRAEHLAVAMDCRLYRNTAPRTRYREICMTARDWAVLCVTCAFAAAVMGL